MDSLQKQVRILSPVDFLYHRLRHAHEGPERCFGIYIAMATNKRAKENE